MKMISHVNRQALAVAACLFLTATAHAVSTPNEDAGGTRTPDYATTVAWCERLAAAATLLHFDSFGLSGQGRPLPVLVADRRGRFTPEQHRDRDDHVVLLVQACIHAGESCGKDAGLALLRDLVENEDLTAELLSRTTLVFIPIFNVDGHERISPYNRINQNGPEEMGWRTNAQNLNLNRDYLKADTPEMRAWLGLFQAWLPDFFIDIHSTDGADYQYAVTYAVETHGNVDPELAAWTTSYEEAMHTRMAADAWPMSPYVSFRDWHDPASGMQDWVATPRFSQGYTALQNRPGLLIETHMLKDYATRVAGAGKLVRHTLLWVNEHATQLRRVVTAADARAAGTALRARPFPLRFAVTDQARPITFLGIGYESVTSEVTGGTWLRTTGEPVTQQLPYHDVMDTTAVTQLPEAYLVPPEWTAVVDRLVAHGLELRRLAEPVEMAVRGWRLTDPKWREQPYEGHHPVTFNPAPLRETRLFPTGTVVVDMNQRAARVAAHLLEPEGPDALVGWGFFDAVFERVEYVESYVIEQMIPELLKQDPQLAVDLAARKQADPEFAADPWAIRYWFYAKTPYFDNRVGIYPVAAVDDPARLRELLSRTEN